MSHPDPQLELERTFRLMDVADEIRRQHRRISAHLEASDREKIKAHLLERYRAMGHQADPTLIDEAIGLVLAQRHRFRPATDGFQLKLARLYVQRGRVARLVGIPLLIIVAVIGTVNLANNAIEGRKLRESEKVVETRVLDFLRQERATRTRAEQLAADLARASVSAAGTESVTDLLNRADSRLDEAERFLGEFAPRGVPDHAITPGNHPEVARQLVLLEASLRESERFLSQGEDQLAAESSLAESEAAVQRVYSQISDIVLESEAAAEASRIYAEARSYLNAGDLAKVREALTELQAIYDQLDQEYTLVVVRGRERDNTRHYLIVQALGPDQTPLSLRIRSEETQQVEEVAEWGERVSKDTYDRIATDYREDNVIDDRIFGEKRRGYREPERRYPDLGQITRY